MVKDIKLYIMTIEKELGYVCPILRKKQLINSNITFTMFISGDIPEYFSNYDVNFVVNGSLLKILINKRKKCQFKICTELLMPH